MTELLLKIFIRNKKDSNDTNTRASYGKLSGGVGIVLNALLFVFKFIAGAFSNSISIMADAFNNLFDASSSVISLVGFKLSGKSADTEHPYGHARYEYLAALFIAVTILVVGVELLKESLSEIFSPTETVFNFLTFIILLVSIVIKLWLSVFNKCLGKKINSETLKATAIDSRNDSIATGVVLIALVVSHFTSYNLDGIMGLFVALFILYSGFKTIKETINPLLGQAPDPRLVENIREKILSYEGVLGTHDLMVHDYGPGRQFASVHVEMAAEQDSLECHDLIDNIERDFFNRDGIHMVVHYDPIVTSDESVNDFRHWLYAKVRQIDERLTIHDLRMVPGITHTNVIFDCVKPQEMTISDTELKKLIEDIVNTEYPDFYCVITIDSDYAPISK